MPGWVESSIALIIGSATVVLAFRHRKAIVVMAIALLEALGLPINTLVALTHRPDPQSESGGSSER
jgi:hypothetical protein